MVNLAVENVYLSCFTINSCIAESYRGHKVPSGNTKESFSCQNGYWVLMLSNCSSKLFGYNRFQTSLLSGLERTISKFILCMYLLIHAHVIPLLNLNSDLKFFIKHKLRYLINIFLPCFFFCVYYEYVGSVPFQTLQQNTV